MAETVEGKRIDDENERYRFWEELERNNNTLKTLGWLIEGFDVDRVAVEDILGDGIGNIIEMYLQEQKRIVAEYVPKLKEKMNEEAKA